MRIFEDRLIPSRNDQVCVGLKCDLCGKVSESIHDWSISSHDLSETEVSIKTIIRHSDGYQYPEGGNSINYEIDICPECFMDKLVPWLKSQGADIKKTKSDW